MADVQNTAVTKGKERLLLLLHTILPPSHKVPEIYYIHTRWQGVKILETNLQIFVDGKWKKGLKDYWKVGIVSEFCD